MFGPLRLRRKPETPAEDITLSLYRLGKKAVKPGIEASLMMPSLILGTQISLKKVYGLQPETESPFWRINRAMNEEDNATAMEMGEELRKELLNTSGSYELTYKVLLAYQPSLAEHLPEGTSGKPGGLKAFASDLQNAFDYLVPS